MCYHGYRREIQNREVTQRLAQLAEGRSAVTAAAAGDDGGDSSSDEEMDPQEALAAVRRLTRSLLPMMLGPRMLQCPPPPVLQCCHHTEGQLTIHDLWMDIQANRGPDWVPPDQSMCSLVTITLIIVCNHYPISV